MIGPRSTLVHPHRRLGRRLLPFLIAMTLGPLACTSDQTTGPTAASPSESPFVAATGSHPRARNESARLAASAMIARSSSRLSTSRTAFSVSSTGPSVLILSDVDAATTSALADTLTAAGFQVTVRPGPEYSWDGTNPGLAGFNAVVHLDGATYDLPLTPEAQSALVTFVQNGGGYIGAQWDGYEAQNQPDMADLALLGVGFDASGPEHNCAACDVTYQVESGQETHPVLAGLPSSFVFHADANDGGPLVVFSTEPSTVLMHLPSGGPAVIVRSFGSGKVVNFSFAPNYPYNDLGDPSEPATLFDSNIKRLYINAVRWTAGVTGGGEPAVQTIDFGPLSDKAYGNPDFSISATASSGLPVSFTANGPCSVVGTLVSITGVGACTLTAQQAGNEDFQPATDVSRSFNIAKGQATITLTIPSPVFDGTAKSASATTNPAGLAGLTLTYTQGGSSVTPVNAGAYQVSATLNNPNYQASPASGTLTIQQAAPVILWTPGALSTGTPLGPSQLNARAMGMGGSPVTGSFNYNPTAGTAFDAAGTVSLSTQFTSSNPNYSGGSKTVSLTISGAMKFTGFFLPVRNQPFLNTALAGSAIPIKFTIGGYRGLRVMRNEPTSVEVSCPAGAPQNTVLPLIASAGGLRSMGYSYTYVWKTDRSWGGTCRKFMLTLADGSTHEATFRFLSGSRILTAR
jgi:MBG domain/Trehalose utilisation